jgi:hypothetical protein
MVYRSWLLVAALAHLLLACGGEARQSGSGGKAGSPTVTAGQGGSVSSSGGSGNSAGASGGRANGGSANGGSGGATLCCAAFPACPASERQAGDSECPGNTSCHQVSLCCSTIWCVTNDGAGGAAGSGGGVSHDCNGLTCTATQACVAYRTVGGAVTAPDAGTCSPGNHPEGNHCLADFAYKCADLQGACQNQPVSCACAQPPAASPGVCPKPYATCSQQATSADPSAQLICQQLVP